MEAVTLFKEDFVVLKQGVPVRFEDKRICIWHINQIINNKMILQKDERFVNTTTLYEPFKTELINQIGRENMCVLKQ